MSKQFTAASLFAGFSLLLPRLLLSDQAAIALEPIQVRTASRVEKYLVDTLASVSVITTEDIRRSAAEDLYELLRLEAGIDIVRTGGAGQQTSVFMRGGNSNHALVLIDGVRVASSHTGAYAWEHLPLNLVERVEIVRGPRGSMYGSEAIGGVIQVFTRFEAQPYLRATVGSRASRELEAGNGFTLGPGQYTLSAAYRDTDGISAQNEHGFNFDPDRDGFESRNVSLGGSGDLVSGSWQFRLTGLENEVEFDQGISTSDQLLASASLSRRVSQRWAYRLYAGWDDGRLSSDFGFFSTRFDSQRLDLGWENRLRLREGVLVLGFDHHDEEGQSELNYAGARHNTGLFTLWERPVGDGALQLSGRLDDNSLFGSELTHQAAFSFSPWAQTELVVSLGSAFRAPTLSEQFSPGFGGLFAGNPGLEPETSRSAELILRFNSSASSQLSIAAYRTRVEGLISFSGVDFRAENINRAALDGVELEYASDWNAWTVSASATFQRAEDRESGAPLLRRPGQKASLRLSRAFSTGAWIGAEWYLSGDQQDVGDVRLPGYAVVNLSAGLPLTASTTLEARMDNLLDHDYEPARGFNSTGRAAFLSVRWSPEARP